MKYEDIMLRLYMRFCTRYESHGTCGQIYNTEKMNVNRSCFHQTYPSCKRHTNFDIKIAIFKGTRLLEDSYNHFCPFTYKEIVSHIDELKKLMKFDYTITNKKDMYLINVKYKGRGIYFRILVSWIRYLYEFPANMILKEALRMKKVKEFKDMNMFSLHAFLCNCILGRYIDNLLNDNGVAKLRTIDELKDHIKELLNTKGLRFRTMDMFVDCKRDGEVTNKFNLNRLALLETIKHFLPDNVKIATGALTESYDLWNNNKRYIKARINLYKENLKLLKEKQDEQ